LRAFKSGARDFFRKPVNLLELQETVDGILSARKSSRENRRPFKTEGTHQTGLLKKLTSSQPLHLIHVINYIEDNLSTPINLDILSEKAGVSKYHFSRIFKDHIGMSPMQFLLSRRITRAKELLKREDTHISTVASSVGFNDMSSFTVQFKKFAGMTPIKFKLSKKKTQKKFSTKQKNHKK
jgi:AraC family transcriptional regulator